ncbi:DUF4160 domain-containing protein [Cronobacter turicensis]|uniref:DUF4160 domain-containing protein n=2 Tax=Cronobacter turicensis TaxID=413502 RepID=A0A2T7B7L1_9ENTR|nr:DUF4160 domain-containing protein [Cronobacter turicensis]MEB8538503.1 DUF4160 domain-containing protein [Cronobacter sakazakii]EKM0361726.1 DUF4160 domain-containing protein [Cronobacter turicensis]EKM0378111.1 DUF4160 domain-containing protein [Cronobacter turicensis]EKM0527937.1 DUF4160 domain-containing protein [Cronobacter turicensis]EKM0665873.1 DUF4160 domain-containing protein [Cronobacter turicensis]
MPVILRIKDYRFFFYSNEGNPREPAHIHVRRGGAEAKFWLSPFTSLARNHGFAPREVAELLLLVTQHQQQLTGAWYDYFS